MYLRISLLLTTALLGACLDTTEPAPTTSIETPAPVTAAVTAPTWHGVIFAATDYQSASLTIVDAATGKVSESEFLDSGSVNPQLATFLSGDLALVRDPGNRNEIVIIDRKNSSLNFIDPQTHQLRVQYSVGEPEYGANPYDYVAVSDTVAYVVRYGIVFDENNDIIQGNDILVLNPENGLTIDRVDLSPEVIAVPNTTSTTYARANGATLVGDYLYVMLENQTLDFKETDAKIVIIDTADHSVVADFVLRGRRNCSALVYAAAVSRAYTACGGQYFDAGRADQSAIIALDATDPLVPAVAFEVDPGKIDSDTYMTNSITLIAPDVVGVIFEGITDWGTGAVVVPEALYAVDVSATANEAELVYEGQGAYILSALGDSENQRLYIADAVFGDEKVLVYAADTETLAFSLEHTIQPGSSGLPVRSMAKY